MTSSGSLHTRFAVFLYDLALAPYHAASVMFETLVFAVLLLIPAFIQAAITRADAGDAVIRGLTYADDPGDTRRVVDVYPPPPLPDYIKARGGHQRLIAGAPVIVLIQDGVWTGTKKELHTCMALALSRRYHCLVVVPSLRPNAPSTSATNPPASPAMSRVEDVRRLLRWCNTNARTFGGDATHGVCLVAQGAGVQLAIEAVVSQLTDGGDERSPPREYRTPPRLSPLSKAIFTAEPVDSISYREAGVSSLVAFAGIYDLPALYVGLRKQGRFRAKALLRTFAAPDPLLLASHSPVHLLETLPPYIRKRFPPIHVHHGTADRTVPLQSVRKILRRLRGPLGVQVHATWWHGWSRTRFAVETIMADSESAMASLSHDVGLLESIAVTAWRRLESQLATMVKQPEPKRLAVAAAGHGKFSSYRPSPPLYTAANALHDSFVDPVVALVDSKMAMRRSTFADDGSDRTTTASEAWERVVQSDDSRRGVIWRARMLLLERLCPL